MSKTLRNIGLSYDLFGGLPQLKNAKYVSAFGSNLSTGNNDLYTCPSGKKALVTGLHVYNNSGVGAINYYFAVKISAAYYRMHNSLSVNDASRTAATTTPAPFVLEAGEAIAVNIATNNGANVWTRVIEFDDDVPLSTSYLTSFSAGDNTLYTVPAGKSAIFVPQSFGLGGANPVLVYVNDSGAARDVSVFLVPSGGSAGNTNRINASTNVSDGSSSSQGFIATLDAGDFVVLNTSDATAGQFAYVTYAEI